MPHFPIKSKQVPDAKVNYPAPDMRLDVTADNLNRKSAGGFMFVNTRIGFQDRQYHFAHERTIVSNILNLLRAFSE